MIINQCSLQRILSIIIGYVFDLMLVQNIDGHGHYDDYDSTVQ